MTAEHTLVRAKVDEVAAKVIDGEAVLINLATGVYYSMRGSGAYLWSQLESGSTLSRLGDIVAIQLRDRPGDGPAGCATPRRGAARGGPRSSGRGSRGR